MSKEKLYNLPKIDLVDIPKSELKKIISTKTSYKDSKSINLEHYIQIENRDFLVGNTKIIFNSFEDFIYIDFNPFSEIINEKKVVDCFIDKEKKDRLYLMNILSLIIDKSEDKFLSSYSFISKEKKYDLNKDFKDYILIDAEAMIKNYRGRFDIVANIQSVEYLSNNFRHSIDNFFVEHINVDKYWRETLRKININSSKPFYNILKSLGFHVSESFSKYQSKLFKYAKDNGFL